MGFQHRGTPVQGCQGDFTLDCRYLARILFLWGRVGLNGEMSFSREETSPVVIL